jgi:hypothetical protein
MSKGLRRMLEAALRRRGLFGSIGNPLALVANLLKDPLALLRSHAVEQALSEGFDREHGVDTEGTIVPEQLDATSENRVFAAPYQAVLPETFFHVMKLLPIDFARSLFIDFGSGKGRALLLASELPFKKIVGIEFSSHLQQVAEANLRQYRSTTQQCRSFELVCSDAVAYGIPPEPAVFFFFNPFGEEVMAKVAAGIRRSLQQAPRTVFVVYFNPQVGHVWEALETLEPFPLHQASIPYSSPALSPAFRGQAVAVWVTKRHAALAGRPQRLAG